MNKINLMAALVAVLILVGCASENNTDIVPDDTQDTSDIDVGEGTNDVQDDSTAEVRSGDDGGSDLRDILQKHLTEYSVDYTLVAQDAENSMRMIYDLPRYATVQFVDGKEMRNIFDGQAFYSCNNLQGEWMCLDLGVKQENNMDPEEKIMDTDTVITYIGLCSIAGESGKRFEITVEEEKSSICYTADGILLEMVNANFEMKATKVSRMVEESVFALPASPTKLSFN